MVYCYGAVGVTEDALGILCHQDIQVAFLTASGHALQRTAGACRLVAHGAAAAATRGLRDPRASARLGRGDRHREDRQPGGGGAALSPARRSSGGATVIAGLEDVAARCAGAEVESLRGLEGATAAAWFGLLGQLLHEPWQFRQRVRRPPTDPVNALLSLGYTWVLNRTVARCEAVGLEVNLGALHDWRPGRPSLACDLMEPLRVPAVDRWVIAACNQGSITAADFVAESGGIRLQPDSFGRILYDWEKHWARSEQEKELDELLGRLEGWLRQSEGASPIGLEDDL